MPVLLPHQFLQQPQGRTFVNTANRLGKDISFLWNAADRTNDSTNEFILNGNVNGQLLTQNSTPRGVAMGATAAGAIFAQLSSRNTTSYTDTNLTTIRNPGTSFTFGVAFRINATSVDVDVMNITNSGSWDHKIGLQSFSSKIFSAVTPNNTLFADNASAAGDWVYVVAVCLNGNFQMYVNGVKQAQTTAGTEPNNALSIVRFNPSNVSILTAFASRAVWTQDDVTSWTANPWQLFAPQQRRLFISVAAAPAVTSAYIYPRRTPTQQPQAPVGVDWSNPISRALVFGATPVHLPRDAINQKVMYGGSTAGLPGVAGVNYNLSGQRAGLAYKPVAFSDLQGTYPNPQTATQHSGMVVLSNEENAYPMTVGVGMLSWSDNNSFQFKMGADGTVDVGVNSNGGTPAYLVSTSTVPLKKLVVLVYVVDGSGTTIYIDGVPSGFSSTRFNAFPQTPRPFGYSGSAGTNSKLVYTYFTAAWSRALSVDEVNRLTANPWQLFQPQPRRFFAELVVDGIYPNSDITTTGWSAVPPGPLYAAIDETTPNDSDYIVSPNLAASPGPAVFGLNQSAPAGSYTVNVRAKYGLTAGQFRVSMLDSGGTSVGTSAWTAVTGAFTTYPISLTTTGTAVRVRIEVQ